VTGLRLQLAAFTTIAAIVIMAGAPLLQTLHQGCRLPHHDCGTTAKISRCCCDDRSAQSESTLVQERMNVRAHSGSLAALPCVAYVALPPVVSRPIHQPPPWRSLLDLPTLFAALLI
jgi:hypothetical protein